MPTVVFTDRSHGDLAVGSANVDERRRAVVAGRWTWLRQVHGARVVVVNEPGAHAGEAADAAVTATPGCVVAVQVADCVPVALVSDDAVGVAHAGWRGLAAGVIPATVEALRRLGAGELRAVVGPCIHAECYEFGADDLDRVASALGAGVRATARTGAPALDLVAGVRVALGRAGVEEIEVLETCTACSGDHWSFRARGEPERQAVVAWM